MASKVGIWNQALQRLGTRRVETDTEDTAEAEALDAVWDEVRLLVLESHPWSFARVTDQLARLVDTPGEVWKYFYQLPADLVSILRVSDATTNYQFLVGDSIPYERQFDDRIATDAEQVYLFYTRDVEDMNLWVPSVRSVLAWRLAQEVAYTLTESTTKVDRAEASFLRELDFAKSKDSQRSVIKPFNATEVVTSRRSGLG